MKQRVVARAVKRDGILYAFINVKGHIDVIVVGQLPLDDNVVLPIKRPRDQRYIPIGRATKFERQKIGPTVF